MEVRHATPDDAFAIADVHVRAWQAAYRGLVPQPILDGLDVDRREAFWTRVLTSDRLPRQEIWVASARDAVTGFACAGECRDDDADRAQTGELQAIYVDPLSWRSGAGSALMAAVLDYLRRSGFEDATLWMVGGNTIAAPFYARHGWTQDGARKHEVWDGAPMDEARYRIAL